jgi:hypothetical protein
VCTGKDARSKEQHGTGRHQSTRNKTVSSSTRPQPITRTASTQQELAACHSSKPNTKSNREHIHPSSKELQFLSDDGFMQRLAFVWTYEGWI